MRIDGHQAGRKLRHCRGWDGSCVWFESFFLELHLDAIYTLAGCHRSYASNQHFLLQSVAYSLCLDVLMCVGCFTTSSSVTESGTRSFLPSFLPAFEYESSFYSEIVSERPMSTQVFSRSLAVLGGSALSLNLVCNLWQSVL